MDESELFSDSILDFVRDKDKFEEINRLFEQIPDEVFAAIVDSASSDEQRGEPRPLAHSEFKCTNMSELQQLIAKNTNENTKHSTNTWLRRYQKRAEERGFESSMLEFQTWS